MTATSSSIRAFGHSPEPREDLVCAPRHLAIIPDGNRRWARQHHLPLCDGHVAGARNFWRLIPTILDAGPHWVTLFLFSTENWARGQAELAALWEILANFFVDCAMQADRQGFAARVIGDLADERVPEPARAAIVHATSAVPSNSSIVLTFAVNYGSVQDFTAAARRSSRSRGDPMQMLSTSGMPPVDLLIRTGGNHRLSNFLEGYAKPSLKK